MSASADFLFLMGPRACGKTSVGEQLARRLKDWRLVDLDAEYQRRNSGLQDNLFAHDPEQYYRGSNAILREWLGQTKIIMALGGGTLISPSQAMADAVKTAALCQNRGEMVLLLPSRFDWCNRRILLQRELQRGYLFSRNMQNKKSVGQAVFDSYNARIGFYRQQADAVYYGADPERCACRIIKLLGLR